MSVVPLLKALTEAGIDSRRRLESLGHRVLALKRVRMGSVSLGNLKEGSLCELSPKEVRALFKEQ